VGYPSIQHLFDACRPPSNNHHIQVRSHTIGVRLWAHCFSRSITTPYQLPYFGPFRSLRVLLTPTELRKPWVLYLTPGLLAAEFLHITYVVIGLRALRNILLPSLAEIDDPQPQDLSFRSLVVYLAIALFSTAILCPLEVISTRLAVQRNHESAEFNSVVQEEVGDAEDLPEYSPAEDVIGYEFFSLVVSVSNLCMF
jgi:hypothetical protein